MAGIFAAFAVISTSNNLTRCWLRLHDVALYITKAKVMQWKPHLCLLQQFKIDGTLVRLHLL